MAVLILELKAHQLITLNGVFILLLLYKYRIILINQIDFTLSIITSAFKHQWLLVFQAEVHELSTIYSNQEETDTGMMLNLHRAAYKNAVIRTPDTYIFVTLLYHAHTIKQTDCIPWFTETSTTNQLI